MSNLDDRVKELKDRAAEKRRESAALGEQSQRSYDEARELENQAAALVVPFQVGDVIECETNTHGWKPKTMTIRLKVASMMIEGDHVEVRGWQVSKQGKLGNHKWVYLGGVNQDRFLRVIEPEKKD